MINNGFFTDFLRNYLFNKFVTDIQQIAMVTSYDTATESTNITSVNQKYITNSNNSVLTDSVLSSVTLGRNVCNNSSTKITGGITSNSVQVSSVSGFNVNDKVTINREYYKITGISGNTITVTPNFINLPNINDQVLQVISQVHLVNNSNQTLFLENVDIIKKDVLQINCSININSLMVYLEVEDSIMDIPDPPVPTNLQYSHTGSFLIVTWDNMNVQYYEIDSDISNSTTSNNSKTYDLTDPFYNINLNRKYYLRVRSVNRHKKSAYTDYIEISFGKLYVAYVKKVVPYHYLKLMPLDGSSSSGIDLSTVVGTNLSVLYSSNVHEYMVTFSDTGKYFYYAHDPTVVNLLNGTSVSLYPNTYPNWLTVNWVRNENKLTSLKIDSLNTGYLYNADSNTYTNIYYNFDYHRHIVINDKIYQYDGYFNNMPSYGFTAIRVRELNGTLLSINSFSDAPYGFIYRMFSDSESANYIYWTKDDSGTLTVRKYDISTGTLSTLVTTYTSSGTYFVARNMCEGKIYGHYVEGGQTHAAYYNTNTNTFVKVYTFNETGIHVLGVYRLYLGNWV